MAVKLFEVRDRATFIPMVAVRLETGDDRERFLMRRAGFSLKDKPPHILLGEIAGGKFYYDSFNWGCGTRKIAHDYIRAHWDELESGSVICCETIRGERDTPKISEFFEFLNRPQPAFILKTLANPWHTNDHTD